MADDKKFNFNDDDRGFPADSDEFLDENADRDELEEPESCVACEVPETDRPHEDDR